MPTWLFAVLSLPNKSLYLYALSRPVLSLIKMLSVCRLIYKVKNKETGPVRSQWGGRLRISTHQPNPTANARNQLIFAVAFCCQKKTTTFIPDFAYLHAKTGVNRVKRGVTFQLQGETENEIPARVALAASQNHVLSHLEPLWVITRRPLGSGF